MSRCILVLGVPRSGTSCVAGVLWRLGVDMGSGHLQPADKNNPAGYYEDLRWQKLNKAITGFRYGTEQPSEIDGTQKAKYCALARRCNATAEKNNQIWGFKNPRACFTAQFIWPCLEDVRLVVTVRKPLHSAKSIREHSRVTYGGKLYMTLEEARAYIRIFSAALQNRIDEFPGPILAVNYRALITDPKAEVEALEAFCYEGVERKPDFTDFQRAVEWVDRGRSHYER